MHQEGLTPDRIGIVTPCEYATMPKGRNRATFAFTTCVFLKDRLGFYQKNRYTDKIKNLGGVPYSDWTGVALILKLE